MTALVTNRRDAAELFRHQQLNELIDAALRSRANHEAEIVLPLTGRCLHIEASAAGGERDNEACVVLVFHDMTELRRLETIRKDFVANVSHELRTPLTSIRGAAETLHHTTLDDATRADLLGSGLQRSNRWRLISIGAYFAYVEHPFGSERSTKVSKRLADEENLLTIPGDMFGSGQERFIRLAFANVSDDKIPIVLERLERFGA